MTQPRNLLYVRCSTDIQAKGDTFERQRELAQKYAAETEEKYEELPPDEGVSAYTGANALSGVLNSVLNQIADGTIAAGSFLWIESFDRLSRQNPFDSLALVTRIVNSSVGIVTLADRRVWTRETLSKNPTDLFVAIPSLITAHQESAQKSNRLNSAWRSKRLSASSVKVTRKAPAWLRLSDDRKRFELVPERAKVIKRIFELSIKNYGAVSIAKELNRKRIPTWGPGSSPWIESYIKKILANRAVVGEAQFCRVQKLNERKTRVPDGEPLPGYYPSVVSEADFLRSRDAIRRRKISGKGRKGKNYTNLFSGLIRCGECRAPVRFTNKGYGPHGGQYLRCTNSLLNSNECDTPSWRYVPFEKTLVAHLRKLDVNFVLGAGKRDAKIADLEDEALNVDQLIRTEDATIARLLSIGDIAADVPEVAEKIVEANQRRIDLQKRKSDLDAEVSDLRSQAHATNSTERDRLLAAIDTGKPESEPVRRMAAGEIRNLVRTITLRYGPQLFRGMRRSPDLFSIHIEYVSGETDIVFPSIDHRAEGMTKEAA